VLFFLRDLEVIMSEFRSKVCEFVSDLIDMIDKKNVLIYLKERLPFYPLCNK